MKDIAKIVQRAIDDPAFAEEMRKQAVAASDGNNSAHQDLLKMFHLSEQDARELQAALRSDSRVACGGSIGRRSWAVAIAAAFKGLAHGPQGSEPGQGGQSAGP